MQNTELPSVTSGSYVPQGDLTPLQKRIRDASPRNKDKHTSTIDNRPKDAPESAMLVAKVATAGMIEADELVSRILDTSRNDNRGADEVLRSLQDAHITHQLSVADVEADNINARRINISSEKSKAA